MEQAEINEMKELVKTKGYRPGNEYILDIEPFLSDSSNPVESLFYDAGKDELTFRVYDRETETHRYWSPEQLGRRVTMAQYLDILNATRRFKRM